MKFDFKIVPTRNILCFTDKKDSFCEVIMNFSFVKFNLVYNLAKYK